MRFLYNSRLRSAAYARNYLNIILISAGLKLKKQRVRQIWAVNCHLACKFRFFSRGSAVECFSLIKVEIDQGLIIRLAESFFLAIEHVLMLPFSLFEDLRHLVKLLEWHVLGKFLKIARYVFRSHAKMVINLCRVDVIQNLCVAEAFNRRLTVKLDFALTIVLNRIELWMLPYLGQNEGNFTSLVLEVDVHV